MRLTLLFFGVFLMSFSSTADTTKEKVLYFCDYANGMFSYGLESNKLKLLYKSEVNNYVMSISETADGNIVFSECAMLGVCKIKTLNKETFLVSIVGQGSSIQVYENKLIFTNVEDKFNGHELRVAKTNDISDYIHSEHIHGPVEPSKVIASEEGVYYTNKSLGVGIVSTLFYYSYSEQKSISIRDDLLPVFYSEDDFGLVAYDLAKNSHKLVKVSSNPLASEISTYTNLGISDPTVVKDKQNLFYSRYATRWLIFERTNIYKKNLSTGKEDLLIENKPLLSGFVSD